jgi:NAD(P)-dependent dehydrogenase (short-subunit alcohol dehydrogenase family)
MSVFQSPYKALVIGASGAIGAAFIEQLQHDPLCQTATAVARAATHPNIISMHLDDEASIEQAAEVANEQGPFDLILVATGVLHGNGFMPEKRLADINMKVLQETFVANTFGPALLLKHFLPLLTNQGVMALISAKVGSIEDNRLGGWYSYRASKAALNMLIKTASIELRRQKPEAAVVAIHPGTVISNLSKPFAGGANARPASVAASEMLATIQSLEAKDSGQFFAYDGQPLPW